VRNKIINTGAPIIAVITPMGISRGLNKVLDIVSQIIINAALATQEAGMSIL
jgi:hypothetical protein